MSSSEFAGKAVIVTGAAQGIGRTIAEQFIRQGARVLIFDLDAELAMETTRQLSPDGNMAACVGGDVSRREDVHRAVETCIERFGRLDVMVAHAGIADAQPLLEIDEASWRRILDVNLTGVFLCTQEAGRVMARSGGGTIVVTASTNAFWVESNLAHYNTSKGGVVAFVRSAAIDLAKTVLFLASSESSYITGQTLVLDGGQTLGILVDPPGTPIPGSGRQDAR